MADDLFTLQAVIVEERLIRHHVAVLAVDHHDHFMKSLDGMAISLQPGFSQLAAGDVFDDAYAHWGRVSVARASRNRDPYPNQLAVFTPIAHLQAAVSPARSVSPLASRAPSRSRWPGSHW